MKNKTKKPSISIVSSITLSLLAVVISFSGINPLSASVTSVAASDNLLLNSQFKALDYGTGTFSSSRGAGTYFNTMWRAKHIESTSSATLQQMDEVEGGTRVTLSNTAEDYFYIRTTIPDAQQFDGKDLTVRADIGDVDSGLLFDFYVNLRWNSSTWTNVIDTGQSSLTSGAHTATMTVPDLSAYENEVQAGNGGLEVAFRINSPNPQTNAEVEIKGISLYEGSNLSAAPLSSYAEERSVLTTYYESAGYQTGIVGLDSFNGQKRATFPMTTAKRERTSYDVRFFDALGNEGKVSTYSKTGARVDNQTPDSVRNSTTGIIFVFYESDIAGIGLSWIVDSEIK